MEEEGGFEDRPGESSRFEFDNPAFDPDDFEEQELQESQGLQAQDMSKMLNEPDTGGRGATSGDTYISEEIAMQEFSTEKLSQTEENSIRIQNARTFLKNMYPEGEDYIDSLILDIQVNAHGEKKVIYIGPKGGNNGNLFRQDGEVNSKINRELLGKKAMSFNEVRELLFKDIKTVYEFKEESKRIENEIKDNLDYIDLETTTPEARERALKKNERLGKELAKLEDNFEEK